MASDEVLDVRPPETVNPSEPIEYHKPVSWLLDLRNAPITRDELIALLGQGPLQAVQEVRAGKDALLHRLAILEAEPTADTETYLRVACELRKYGPVERPTGVLEPRRTSSQNTEFSRDPRVRAWILQRAQGRCELCSQPAPFIDERQEPYLESHHITMLADGNGAISEAVGLTMDGSKFGMGTRSQRYSMIVNDGVVEQLNVEAPGEYRASSAEHMLDQLATA